MDLTYDILENILTGISTLSVGVIGDGCVDIYWEADMRKSELSREVPHYPLPIREERFSLGASANVVSNLVSLGVNDVKFITCVGKDWREGIFTKLLKDINVSSEYIVSCDDRVTPAYCKPIRSGISSVRYEDPRIDFANFEPISQDIEQRIVQNLDKIVKEIDVLIVSDQLSNGCITEKIIEHINRLGEKITVIVDSRDRILNYKNVIIKPNELEASAGLNIKSCNKRDIELMSKIATLLMEKTNKPVIITLGSNGAIYNDEKGCVHVEAFDVLPPIDFVGAGDAFLASFATCNSLDIGISKQIALEFACLIPTITIKKIGVTGTATPQEIRETLKKYEGEV